MYISNPLQRSRVLCELLLPPPRRYVMPGVCISLFGLSALQILLGGGMHMRSLTALINDVIDLKDFSISKVSRSQIIS